MFNKNMEKLENMEKVEKEDKEINELIDIYLKQLTPFQIKANEIAKRNLGSSYCIEKSIGFLDFKCELNVKTS
jgi:hypothetical protein